MRSIETPQDMKQHIGEEIGVSEWVTIDQSTIDKFADATGDHQWIHVDVERARAGPFGATIAHGFLTLSLLPRFFEDTLTIRTPVAPGVKNVINYGLNKARFPNAVRVDSRIRGRFTLVKVEAVAPNALQITEQYTAEIDGQPKPGCIAEGVMRLMF